MTESSQFPLSTVELAALPWVFTQSQPLDTGAFIREAGRWRVRLDAQILRSLYRSGELQPLLEIRDRAQTSRDESDRDEPEGRVTRLIQLRAARRAGRLVDPGVLPYRERLRFDERRRTDPEEWWNGLIYSRWQLLALPYLRQRLTRVRRVRSGAGHWARLPPPEEHHLETAARLRRIAVAVAGLEARYLPALDPEWVNVTDADLSEWRRYRETATAVALSEGLRYTAHDAQADAEWLLLAAHGFDPLGEWSRLVGRAHRRRWESLTGDALAAMEHRAAAEILLRFCEDLAEAGQGHPIPQPSGNVWHPLTDRLSYRPDELDEVLQDLGVSPHPRVVLAVEGHTEEALMTRVFDSLGWRLAPDLIRLVNLGGVNRNLTLFSAFAVAPLVGERHGDSYDLVRPLTRLIVALDPDRGYSNEREIRVKRDEIIATIQAVLAAQNAKILDSELDELVHIHTWGASCFEYAHFSNEELVAALHDVHAYRGGLTDEQLANALEIGRAHSQDIKQVWQRWSPHVSKIRLADALWPALDRRIRAATKGSGEPPPIAEIAQQAYVLAQQYRHVHVVLRAADVEEP